jgi:hypothetical protein
MKAYLEKSGRNGLLDIPITLGIVFQSYLDGSYRHPIIRFCFFHYTFAIYFGKNA